MRLGIIGLPQSGKSVFFSALTGLSVEVHSYSAEAKAKPNIGVVNIADERLNTLADVFKPKKVTLASINFVDMQGIKKDAKLEDVDLTPIKDTDALISVVRFFENSAVLHPYGKVDGLSDLKIIETELLLLDLQSAQKRIEKIEKEVHKGVREHAKELAVLKKCEEALLKEKPLRKVAFDSEEEKLIRGFQFLSKKPILAAANISESDIRKGAPEEFRSFCKEEGLNFVEICAKVEAELLQTEDGELKKSFSEDLGITEVGRDKVIALSLSALNQITFFTVKGDETRAWLIAKGASAYEAAGKIHSDIQRGFIKAEVVNFNDFLDCNKSMHDCRAHGKLKLEGKEYIVSDGDIIDFKFSI